MDVTNYLEANRLSARELAMKMILDVLETTGITATAGIGTRATRARSPRTAMAVPSPSTPTAPSIWRTTLPTKRIVSAVLTLFDRIINRKLLVRRLYLTATNVLAEEDIPAKEAEQLDLFTDYAALEARQAQEKAALADASMTGKEVTLTWFQPDARKSGGAYVTDSGVVKRVDLYEKAVVLADGRRIPIPDILDVRYDGG